MLDWFRRLRRASRKLVLPTRDAADTRNQAQLNYSKLTFSTADLIARLAVAQKAHADQAAELAKLAPLPQIGARLSAHAAGLQTSADQLGQLLNRQQGSSKELLAERQGTVDELLSRCYAPAWHERLIGLYLAFGFLDETHTRLIKAQPTAVRTEISACLEVVLDGELYFEILAAEIARIPGLADRLALFGRSIAGDALLAVRDSVNFEPLLDEPLSADAATANRQAFKSLEPLINDLIGLHSQRMDRLGLTA